MEAVLLIPIFVIFLFVASLGASAGRFDAMFRSLQSRFSGRSRRAGLFRRAGLRFSHGRSEVDVSWHATESGFVEVRVHWPDTRFQLRIAKHDHDPTATSLGAGLRTYCRINGLIISTNDESRAASMLTEEVIRSAINLRRMSSSSVIAININNGLFTVRVFGRLLAASHLERVVELALDCFDLTQLADAAGIDVMQSDIASDSICKICGEIIRSNLVQCRRCRTPHHEECWLYNGVCSTYGCREPEFTVPLDGKADQVRLP